jgi:histidinol-phosphate aminotransferase
VIEVQPGVDRVSDYTPRDVRDLGARIRAHRNESAFPIPDAILRAIRSLSADELRRYPSDRYDDLARLAGGKLGAQPEAMVFASGSDDLIFALADAYAGPGSSVVTLTPTFGMYRRTALLRGAELREVPYATRWKADPGALISACDATTRLVFLCSPNNPTCELLDGAAVDAIARALPSALIVVDEAYLVGADGSFFPQVARRENVAVIATLSKVPGLAGLRCGFGAAPLPVARVLRRVMQPHTLTIPALAAMTAYFADVFDDATYRSAYRAFIDASLDSFEYGLGSLSKGVTRGATNFIVLEFGDRADTIASALEQRSIMVRRLDSPAFDGAIRINALGPEETAEVINAVKAVMEPSYA